MKTILTYGVRESTAPGSSIPTKVPVIIDRLEPVDLSDLIENCIDRGLIAGLKPTAAEGLAEGIAQQIAKEFSDGHGVSFGQYFYGRLYLNGTTDSNGTLTAKNGVNVRLYKGNEWKLSRNDFSMKFEGSADAPKIDFVVNPETGNRGEVAPGHPVAINGRNLNATGDTNRVVFATEGEDPKTVETFTAAGPDLLAFVCPALTDGKKYAVTVYRTDPNGVTRSASGKNVVAVGSTGPAPEISRAYSSGHDEEAQGKFYGGVNLNLEGENFAGAQVSARLTYEGQERTLNFSEGVTIEDGTLITLKGGDEGTLEENPINQVANAIDDEEGTQVTFIVTTPNGTDEVTLAFNVEA